MALNHSPEPDCMENQINTGSGSIFNLGQNFMNCGLQNNAYIFCSIYNYIINAGGAPGHIILSPFLCLLLHYFCQVLSWSFANLECC